MHILLGIEKVGYSCYNLLIKEIGKSAFVGENMDYSNEQHFVQSFIRKARRERLLYELTTPEKRYDGVNRFCHQAKELLPR